MALAYQFGIPKEKGNDYAVGDRETVDDMIGQDVHAGLILAVSDEPSDGATNKVKLVTSGDDVPCGVLIKISAEKCASVCLSGRAVPVLVNGEVEPGDELELADNGRAQKLSTGQFIGVCAKADIKARDNNGNLSGKTACLIDFKF